MSLPVYTSEVMQQWDKYTIENEPIASVDLMERAASLAAKAILGRNVFQEVAIFCGPGNNGGDGLVIARLLSEENKKVTIYHLNFAEGSDDFKVNYKRLPKTVTVVELTESSHKITNESELIIDAVFGSGLNRPVEGWIAEVIIQMNGLKGRKVAIDIPSGLYATNNHENTSFPAVFEADETLSFMAPKMPFFFPTYAGFVGTFRIINIGLHPEFKAEVLAKYILSEDIALVPRRKFDHKGSTGFLTLIGGLGDMTGAIVIAARAASRAGVGYVNAISDKDGKIPLNTSTPEVIWQPADEFKLNDKTTAIAIGPGLGTTEKSLELLKHVLDTNQPMVLDADALNLLAQHTELNAKLPENSILTPHIGELKRIVGIHRSDEELLAAQKEFSIKYKVFIIQKGPHSKLTTPTGKIYINSSGNPGMASAGMGDALTGIIGAFLAQGYTAKGAASFGMFIHGYAADTYARDHGEIGLLASDIIDRLPSVINRFVRT